MVKTISFLKKTGTLLGNIAASLAAVLLVLLILVFIAGLAVDLRLLHPEAYKQAMLSAGAYESLPAILAEQSALPQSAAPGSQGVESALRNLKGDEREALYRYLFPPAWLRTQAEGLFDHFFAYLNLQSGRPELNISLVDVRARVKDPGMAIYTSAILRSLPVCTLNQAVGIVSRLAGGGGLSGADLCMPAIIDSQATAALFQSQIAGLIAAGIPDQVAFSGFENMLQNNLNPAQLQDLGLARQVLYLLPLVCLGLLLLIALFGVRSRRCLLRWWGMPLLAAAFLAGAGALSLPALANWYLPRALPLSPDLSPRLVDLIARVCASLASSVSGLVSVFAVVLGGLGVVMMLASYVLREPQPKKPGPAPAKQAPGG